MSGEPAKMITLNSSDKQTFIVEETETTRLRILIELMIADIETESIVIPLPTIEGNILAKVIEYYNKHAEVATSDEDKRLWDAEFVNFVSTDTLFGIILAAHYLNIERLLDLTCQKLADMIKDMKPEEVRQLFNFENNYTPEEEEQIRKENQWAFE
ncbi:hypothetical protein MKX03_036873 [Papaver bracteatum]|nr:hypothetical protein MKX03_036873 [Papaver bracteatum]